ncbi:hypothetical protein L596_007408 [Steinernema carpocapsae]|uniref:G-protein coupled receptors family 1 profile domain-containing protein n=1 Tax=Steinernema carpocapsae TaxID=34508 RepID=A0A4U5P999_STECR|nr:hypothetical protein L596_007408 [Steinernema carpocapsae]
MSSSLDGSLATTFNGSSSAHFECTFTEWSRAPNQPGFLRIFSIISVLTVLVVIVVLGNSLVIAAVLLRRRLRSATGLLILSLAVADLLVGTVILPFSIANEVLNGFWIFGDTWCTMWLTMDIWMCTASIYNLVAISIDRYIAIIKPMHYPMLITKFRARCIVVGVWIGSFLICSPSFIVASSNKKDEEHCKCTPANAGTAYIVFSASSSFYVPMIVVIFVYVRIYIAARAATKSIYSGMMQVTATANVNTKNYLMQNPTALTKGEQLPMLRVHRGSSVAVKNSSTNSQSEVDRGRNPSSLNGSTRNQCWTSHTNVNYNPGSQLPRPASAQSRSHSPRRHSDEERSRVYHPGDNSAFRNGSHSVSPTRRSTGSVHSLIPKDAVFNAPHSDQNWATAVSQSTVFPPIDENRIADSDESSSAINQSIANSNPEQRLLNVSSKKSTTRSTTSLADPKKEKNGTVSPTSSTAGNVLSRLIRRRAPKKAGCAYEKRLSLEIKAAKTVAIVTGCFIFCWLGFSILYGFNIETNQVLWSIVFWLGYLNSALNPVIYTVFNREFRSCFKKLLTCNHAILFRQTQSVTHQNLYNSYNSQMRPSAGKFGGYNSSASAPPYFSAAVNVSPRGVVPRIPLLDTAPPPPYNHRS